MYQTLYELRNLLLAICTIHQSLHTSVWILGEISHIILHKNEWGYLNGQNINFTYMNIKLSNQIISKRQQWTQTGFINKMYLVSNFMVKVNTFVQWYALYKFCCEHMTSAQFWNNFRHVQHLVIFQKLSKIKPKRKHTDLQDCKTYAVCANSISTNKDFCKQKFVIMVLTI